MGIGAVIAPDNDDLSLTDDRFGKTGVRSRGELVGRVFLEHYAPRWEDLPHAAPGWMAKGSAIEPDRVRPFSDAMQPPHAGRQKSGTRRPVAPSNLSARHSL